VQFISFDGECREALVLMGAAAPTGTRAVHVESGASLTPAEAPGAVETPDGFLYDADPAAVRAHALGALCGQLRPLGDSNGYLTGPEEGDSPWLRRYRVLYSGKADPKTTRKMLRDLSAATPELKQRGAGLDLLKERKVYATDGNREVSLVIWKIGKSLRHTIVERC